MDLDWKEARKLALQSRKKTGKKEIEVNQTTILNNYALFEYIGYLEFIFLYGSHVIDITHTQGMNVDNDLETLLFDSDWPINMDKALILDRKLREVTEDMPHQQRLDSLVFNPTLAKKFKPVIDKWGTFINNKPERKLVGLFRDLVTHLALLGQIVTYDTMRVPLQLGQHQNYNQNEVAILYHNPLPMKYVISGDKLIIHNQKVYQENNQFYIMSNFSIYLPAWRIHFVNIYLNDVCKTKCIPLNMPIIQTNALTPLHFKLQVPFGEYYQTRENVSIIFQMNTTSINYWKIGPSHAILLPSEMKGLFAGQQQPREESSLSEEEVQQIIEDSNENLEDNMTGQSWYLHPKYIGENQLIARHIMNANITILEQDQSSSHDDNEQRVDIQAGEGRIKSDEPVESQQEDQGDERENGLNWLDNYVKLMQEPFPHTRPDQLPSLTEYDQESVFHGIFFPQKHLTRSHLIALQRLDPYLSDILSKLPDTPEYKLRQGVLTYQLSDKEVPKIAIPLCMARTLYYSLHCEYLHPSLGINKVLYNKFFHTYNFDPADIHSSCYICAVNRPLRPHARIGNKRSFRASAPRQVLFCDIKEAVRPQRQGFRHLLICVDAFSLYIFIIPLRNKESGHMAKQFKIHYTNVMGPLICCYSDNSNSFLQEFKKEIIRQGACMFTSAPYNQKSDFAEAAIRVSSNKLSKLLSDPLFYGKQCDWLEVLPDLCRTINRTPLKHPFQNFTREMLHFGNQTDNFSPLALRLSQETIAAIEVPYIEDLGQYNDFAEYLKLSNKSTQEMRDTLYHQTAQRRRQRYENERPKLRQINPKSVPIGALVFITNEQEKQNRPSTYGPKRRLFRVLNVDDCSVTAQGLTPPYEIKTSPIHHLELVSRSEFEACYPKAFFREISRMSLDWYRRFSKSTKSLLAAVDRDATDVVIPNEQSVDRQSEQADETIRRIIAQANDDVDEEETNEDEMEGQSEEGTTDDPLTRVHEDDNEDTTADHRWNTRTRNRAKVDYPK